MKSITPLIFFLLFAQFQLIGQDQGVEIYTPNSSLTQLQLLPQGTTNDSSEVLFSEDRIGNFGMLWQYDGVNNKLKLFGKSGSTYYGPHMITERGNGNTVFGGDIFLSPEKTLKLKDAGNVTNLTLDPANLTDGVFKSRVTTDEIKLTSVKGQIRAESNVDIFTFGVENATLKLLPTAPSAGDSATIFLSENREGTAGMSWTYDGRGNEMELHGRTTVNTFGPHLRIHRDRGTANVGNGSAWYFHDHSGVNTISIVPSYTPAPPFNTPRGRITTSELEITGGSDLVEFFSGKKEHATPVAGDLVAISDDGQGSILKSTSAYDSKIIGVISGANGVLPGLMLGQKDNEKVSGNLPVAIAGRAYVAVSELSKTIQPGDQITSSSEPGKCMKAEDFIPGTVVGKALSFVENGFVLVLINLQ